MSIDDDDDDDDYYYYDAVGGGACNLNIVIYPLTHWRRRKSLLAGGWKR